MQKKTLKETLLLIFTIFFIFQGVYAASFFSPSKWWQNTKKSPYTTAAVIGGMAIAGTALYYYIKNIFLPIKPKPSAPNYSDEFIKHTIINETISILEKEEAAKIDNINQIIENCINGKAKWKIEIKQDMLLNIEEKILRSISENPNDERKEQLTKEKITDYINNNKDLFNDSLLLHIPKKYKEKYKEINLKPIKNIKAVYNEFHLYLEDQASNIKTKNTPITKSEEKNVKKNKFDSQEVDYRYKIHLMPQVENFIQSINSIIESDTLKNSVISVKFRSGILNVERTEKCPTVQDPKGKNNTKCFCGKKGFYDVLPIIVIETSTENAQNVLNEVYTIFKDQTGLNLTPPFNKQITNLIYYAQGEPIKKISNADEFEAPDLIHYKCSTKNTTSSYHLKNPAEIN